MKTKIKDIKRNIKYFWKYKVGEKLKYGIVFKIKYKTGFKGYLLRGWIVTVVLFIISCILKLFLPFRFSLILKFMSILPAIIGYTSLDAVMKQTTSVEYTLLKIRTGQIYWEEDMKLREGAFEFCVFSSTITVMLYLISLIFSNI